jgi:subtilisin family serine protease
LLLVLFGGCAVVEGQNEQTGQAGEAPVFYHYVHGMGAMPLKLNTHRIGIRFQPGATAEDRASVLLSDDALDPVDKLSAVGKNGAFVVGLKPGADRASVLDTIQRLSAADAVYYASPVVQSRIGFDELVNNKFYVSLPDSVSPTHVEALNAEQHVETVSIRQYPKRTMSGWWLRITKGSTLDALEMSNLYYERLGALGASPGLICLYDIMQSAGPDPYSYFNKGCDQQPKFADGCNLEAMHVPDAWDNGNGVVGSPNIVVAVIDTGVDMDYGDGGGNPDLNPNQWINPSPEPGECPGEGEGEGEHPGDLYGWDFYENDCVPQDASYHGTCSAGVIGARTYNSLGVAGIAGGWGTQAGCKIMPVRVSLIAVSAGPLHWWPSEYTEHSVQRIADGIEYAANHHADILSMSVGFWVCPQYLRDALDAAADADCVLVSAAGNSDEEAVSNDENWVGEGEGEGEGEPEWRWMYPGCIKDVICVGALNACESGESAQRKYGSKTGAVGEGEGEGEGEAPCNQWAGTSFPPACWGSGWGAALDIMAPGQDINTTDIVGCCGKSPGHLESDECQWEWEEGCQGKDPEDCCGEEYGYDYNVYDTQRRYNKTSSATPQVAGVAALVLSATLDGNGNRTLSRLQVQAILQFSADDLAYDREYGNQQHEVADENRDIYTGYGRVNAKAAVDLARAKRTVFRNSAGKHLASFDPEGNFIVEGNLTQSATSGQLDPTADSEFFVRNSTPDEVLKLSSAGNMWIKGKLYEKVSVDLDTAVTVNCLRFRDDSGDTVGLVNSSSFTNSSIEPTSPYTVPAGSIILKGRALVGADPDRDSSQGH